MKKYIRPILLFLLAALVIIQFFRIDKTNPSVIPQQDYLAVTTPPAPIATLIKTACYDCHSHTSVYPWYTNFQPIGWWVKGHINNGIKHLNFSTWTTYDADKKRHKLEECVEVLEDKEMPMLSYMIAHQDAWLTDQQRKELADWFKRGR